MKKLRISFLVGFFVAFGAVALFGGSPVKAISAGPHTSSITQDGGYRALCGGNPYRMDFHPTVSGISLNLSNGRVSYTLNVAYRNCLGGGNHTRAYAITGQSTNCWNAGRYGIPGDGRTIAYDCVKFVGNPAYQANGTELSCDTRNPHQLTNDECLSSDGRRYVIIKSNEPWTTTRNIRVTPARQLQVPNWATANNRSGSATVNAGTVCQFFKYGNNYESISSGDARRCADIRITVRWTVSYNMVHTYSISDDSAVPGQTITWNWGVRNAGPDAAYATVRCQADWSVGRTGIARGPLSDENDYVAASSSMYPTCTNSYTIPAGTPSGTRYCQRLQYRPDSSTVPGGWTTGDLCTTVVGAFTLNPTIRVAPDDVATPGQQETLFPTITRNGTGAATNIAWRVNALVYSPGATPGPGTSRSTSDACAYYTAETSCTQVTGGSGTIASITTSPYNLANLTHTLGATLTPGSRVCYSLSIRPWGGGTDWRHSNLSCVVIGKRPKVQIRGGDLKVHEGGITTSTSTVGGRTYGSWVEYGAVSSGINSTLASGAGLVTGHTSGPTTPAPWSRITFSNTNTAALGNYSPGAQSGNMRNFFVTLPGTSLDDSTYTLTPLAAGQVRVLDFGDEDITLNGASGILGSYIIRTGGTVTIASNIGLNTSAGISGIRNIPGVAIVANQINIPNSVTNIDAWLLANDTIDTCVDQPSDGLLTMNTCQNALVVNGPVQATTIYLRRTAGSDATSLTQAAETFNTPGYAYLWARGLQSGSSQVATTYVVDQPPRF